MNKWILGLAAAMGVAYIAMKEPLDYKVGDYVVKLVKGTGGYQWMVGKNGAIVAQGSETEYKQAKLQADIAIAKSSGAKA